MSGLPNPKNYTNAAAVDLGLSDGMIDSSGLMDEEEKKKRLMAMQRDRMGQSGASVFGYAAPQLLGTPSGGMNGL